MDHVGWLLGRLRTAAHGLPGFQQAADWAVKRLGEWGLANAKTEKWKFGKGWSLTRFQAHLVEPQVQPLIGYPKAWTPEYERPRHGGRRARRDRRRRADFEKYRGKLGGKIVLASRPETCGCSKGASPGGWGTKCWPRPSAFPFRRLSGLVLRRRPALRSPTRRCSSSSRKRRRRPRSGKRSIDRGDGRQRESVADDATRRRRHDLRPGGRPARRERGQGAAASHAGRRALQPAGPTCSTRAAGEDGDRDPGTVSRRSRHERNERDRRATGDRSCQRNRADRCASRHLAFVHWRHGQRRRGGSHDGGDAHPQGRRRQAATDHPDRAVGRRGTGLSGLASLRAGAPRRRGQTQTRIPKPLGLLQPGQRHGTDPRRMDAGQRRDHADLRSVDRTACVVSA